MSRTAKRLVLWCAAGAAAGAMAPAGALAAGAPPRGTATYRFMKAECVETDNGYRSIGSARTWVHYLSAYDGGPTSSYYQKVTIQIDKAVNSSLTSWRKVAGKTYSWSLFTKQSKLPTYSTSAIRTGLQNDAAILTAKVHVRLMRVRRGPDATVWEYTQRSKTFQCLDPSDFG